ncbi:16S rRNA (guanine(527)-N(7))-methyltransferase RsmG [Domibacillus enclensis]|uniref:Ribosomal RNA small subunit methyltransferase G n=1 Tax=Domibacillus enclensis TaxID=1017273 RepID=A0A1N6YXR6_9BACI|nr:16S rRNA (guanine(527)-N(7))-methyltransferase RsmG [Domibacillus enclensis]OXS76522.1 16S rRNA methyltransferase G [Domibacillus enclensis]SIR19259.1 16S rRNA m(7)G-527 methyltransferase [Domibacillus enclensis]
MNIEQFQSALAERGIVLSEEQLAQFNRYYELLVEWNEKMNLTAITEREDVYMKHFFDSITAGFYIDLTKPLRLLDVGAGAGFPSIPLKIVFPDLNVTIIDSLNKRITFLNHLASELGLENVQFVHGRAEEMGQKPEHREQYDLVTARAVARMSVLSELCLPFARTGGSFVAMKAASASDEMDTAKKAIQTLGGKTDDVFSFKLPIENSERTIIVVRKEKQTPKKYPRKAGTPNKTPIE